MISAAALGRSLPLIQRISGCAFSKGDTQRPGVGGNLRPEADAWLKDYSEAGVGKYKMPKTIFFFDDLPKGLSDKILRLKLPELIAKVTVDN